MSFDGFLFWTILFWLEAHRKLSLVNCYQAFLAHVGLSAEKLFFLTMRLEEVVWRCFDGYCSVASALGVGGFAVVVGGGSGVGAGVAGSRGWICDLLIN